MRILLKITNPKGAVMINSDYEPSGNVRRYERGEVEGSVWSPCIEVARKAYIEIKKSPNIDIEWRKYEMVKGIWKQVI